MHKGGRVSEFGGPEVLESGDWPEPELRDGWVVVELRAAALNWHDCLVRQGVHDVDLPQIIGPTAPAADAAPVGAIALAPARGRTTGELRSHQL